MTTECCDAQPASHPTTHADHRGEIARLNRVAGQIEGVRKMIEAGRYCPDILTQLRAARAALRTIEASVLEAHLGHCVQDVMQKGQGAAAAEKIAELVSLFKRYDE